MPRKFIKEFDYYLTKKELEELIRNYMRNVGYENDRIFVAKGIINRYKSLIKKLTKELNNWNINK